MNIFELQEVLIKTTKILAGKNIKVVLEGFAPCVEYSPATKEPTRIMLPALPLGTPHKLVQAIHGYIDHECSHIKFSDSSDICDETKSKLWHYIHNCIEDPRVNRKMGEYYPGSGKNIKAGYDYLFNELKDEKGRSAYSKEFIDGIDFSNGEVAAQFYLQYASLWFAGKMNCSLSKSMFDELDLDKYYEPIMKKADPDKVASLANIETAEDVRIASDYFSEFFSEQALEQMRPDKGKDESDKEGKQLKGKLDRLVDNLRTLEEQLQDEIKKQIEYSLVESKEGIYWTDRFDKTFSNKDIIGRFDRSRSSNVSEFEDETKQVANYLMKDLRRLLEEQRRRYYIGGYKSGKLNSKSLFSVRCGNDRIFKKKNEVRDINAAVSLLIDLSGSMSGSKARIAMQSAYAFAMTLTQLKVPFEIYGFSTEGYNTEMGVEWEKFSSKNKPELINRVINSGSPENIFAFKSFDDPFDINAKHSMVLAGNSCVGMNQNEDSKHVLLALKRLSARQEPVKALFVFSDGQPAFHSYTSHTNCYNQLKFLGQNAKDKYGIDIYSIGIQSDSVTSFYKTWKVINNLKDLPQAVFEYLRKIFK